MSQNKVQVDVNSRFENGKQFEADLERIARERLEELEALAKAEKISLEQLASLKNQLNSSTFNKELANAKRIHALKMQNLKDEQKRSIWQKDLLSGVKESSFGKAVSSTASNIPGLQYLANPVVGAIAGAGAVFGAGAKAGKGALEEYAGYEQATNKTRALAGSSYDAEALTAKSMDVASKTIFNQKDIVQAVNTLVQGGKTFDQALAMVETVAETAIAHGKTIEESAGVLVSTSNQFGISAENVSHISDVFTKATITTALSFQDLSDGMKNAGPALSSMGQSVERTTAILGTLANIGISGAEAGTAIRSIMAMSTGKQGSATLAKYGVSMLGEDGKIRALDEILADFSKALDASGIAEDKKLAEWKKISGEYSGQAKEIAKQTNAIKDQTRLLEEVAGANKELAGTQMQGIQGLINQIQSNWSILKNELGKLLAPLASGALEGIRDGVTNAFLWLNQVFSALAQMFSPFMPTVKAFFKANIEFLTGLLYGSITAILSAVTVLSVLFETANNFLSAILEALKQLPYIGDKVKDLVENNPIAVIKREAERSRKLDQARAEALAKQAQEEQPNAPSFSAYTPEVDFEEAEVSIKEAEIVPEEKKSREEEAIENFISGNEKAVADYNATNAEELANKIEALNKEIESGKALGNDTTKEESERKTLQANLDALNKSFFDAETERALQLGEVLTGIKAEDLKSVLSGEYELATNWNGTTASQSSFAQFDWESSGVSEKQLDELKKITNGIKKVESVIGNLDQKEVIKL